MGESTGSPATTTMSDNPHNNEEEEEEERTKSGQSVESISNEDIELKQENVIPNVPVAVTEQKEDGNEQQQEEVISGRPSSSSSHPMQASTTQQPNDIWLDSLTVLIFFAIVAILFKKFSVAFIAQL